MNRFEVVKDQLLPMDPNKLRVNQFVSTDIEYRGKVIEEDHTLRVVSVIGRGSERLFTLEDMMGRAYNVAYSALVERRQGALIFKGVYPKGGVRLLNVV